ncbi:hypothetical protein FHR32_005326 [Streptosporangium album]|uniref:Uncharacterized protein n=1 Tax=Streptosporangium album TaxID=47479 RepID=A0A7W7WC71_9ACTN|nr:hypothetical protein [Streptosporangium album]
MIGEHRTPDGSSRDGAFVVGGEPDAPDPIDRAGFDQDTGAGAEQEVLQLRMPAELGEVATHHDLVTVLIPHGLVEAMDLAAEPLGLAGMLGGEDPLRSDTVIRCHVRLPPGQ